MAAVSIVLSAGVLGLLYAVILARGVMAKPDGTPEMRSIATAIREGAMAFLFREYRTLAVFVVIVALGLGFLLGWTAGAAYIFGGVCSAGR